MSKILTTILILIGLLAAPCSARDFIMEFVEENYKETQAEFSYLPLIYHSVQVNSSVGPKVLILKGEDGTYRKWLRQYIAQNKEFIARIEESELDAFMGAKAFEIDVTRLHPFNKTDWQPEDIGSPEPDPMLADNQILIVDPDAKKASLLKTVVDHMGYSAVLVTTGEAAIKTFNMQPDKFKMIIVSHQLPHMLTETFLDRVLKINTVIPVIVESGYQNRNLKETFQTRYAATPSVHVRALVLQDLQNTLSLLLNKNA